MTKNISIIGCGWLGLPLAKVLIDEGYTIKGSTTSIDKLDALKALGIDAFYVELTAEGVQGDIETCLSNSEILVINMPPGLRKYPESNFVKRIRYLINHIEISTIKKVLFVSSTSVYSDEESLPIITEESNPNPDTDSGTQLLEVENLLQNNSHFHTTILRFSGLFGADRHPAKVLSGRSNIKNPDAPINLIHLKDCIGIIQAILQQDTWNDTFNASATPHPTRQEYYTSICKAMHLPLPMFDQTSKSKGKYIDSSKLERLLNYEFQVKIE